MLSLNEAINLVKKYTKRLKKINLQTDKALDYVVSQNILSYSYFFTYKNLDRGIIEFSGPTGITNIIRLSQEKIKFLQSGSIYHYLFSFTFSIIIILLFYLFCQNLISLILVILFFLFYNFFF